MSPFDALLSFQLTLLLHATVLLAAVWGLERTGLLRHPGWAELAWRGALFGALLSASLSVAAPLAPAWPTWTTDEASQPAPAATTPPPPAPVGAPSGAKLPATDPAPAPTATRSPTPTPPNEPVTLSGWLAVALLAPWLLGLAIAALRLALQWLRVKRWQRRARRHAPAAAPELQRIAAALSAQLALPATPTLCHDATLASPLLLPDGRVLLPTWVEALTPAQQRALLAHELAHLQRRDPAWRLAQRLAALPLFFHPLARHALHRLEALAEDACDARAAELCGSGRPLAESLAACLSHAGPRAGTPALAVAMAGEPGPVVRRVKNLLEESPMSRPLPPALRRTVLAAALAAAIALPGLAITTVGSDALAGVLSGGEYRSSHITDDGVERYTYRNSAKGERLRVELDGKVEFTADESDVARLPAGAEFVIEQQRGGVTRFLRARNVGGQVERDYRVDGKARAFDAEGRAWLAAALPQLLRETGIQAEARGKRFLAAGGPDALIAEIDRIEADYATRRYLEVLFEHAKLDDARMQRALDIAAGIESDFELRQALQAGLSRNTLAPARQAKLLAVAESIGSDFELAELLRTLAGTLPPQGEALAAWRRALDTIGSDFERRRALEALLESGAPDATALVLDSARGIGSDFEARQVLEAAAPGVRGDDAAREAYFRLLATVDSDFEQRQALLALIGAGPVDVALADAVLESLRHCGSDFEARETLVVLAGAMPADQGLIERYRAVARGLGDFERGQAEKALDRFVVASVD